MSGYEILSLIFQVMTLIFAAVKTTASCMIHFDSTKKDYPSRKVK